jgi:hypothetical protein
MNFKHMDFLSSNGYAPVRLEEGLQSLSAGKEAAKCVVRKGA